LNHNVYEVIHDNSSPNAKQILSTYGCDLVAITKSCVLGAAVAAVVIHTQSLLQHVNYIILVK